MNFAERLNVLQAAIGDPALLVLATVELVHSELPMDEQEAIKRALLAAAVPHWFDPHFLSSLLNVDEPEAEWLHKLLWALTAVEPFSARGECAANVHESARLVLREHLRQSDPEQWRTLAVRARAHVAASSSVHARIEALHHLFAIDQEAAAEECEALDRDLFQKPEWRQALAMSLSEVADAGWLRGSALVESLLIPLQARSQRGEAARLETEASAVVELAERYHHSSGLARAQCLVGDVYQSHGRLDAALDSFQKSLAIIERLVQDDPSNAKWQHELGAAHIHLGDMYQSQDRRVAARASYQKSLAILEQLVQEDPANPGWQRDLSIAHSRLPIHLPEKLLAVEQEGKLQSLFFFEGKPIKLPGRLTDANSFASLNTSQHAALPMKLKLQITSARDLQHNSRIVIEKMKDFSFGKKFMNVNRRHSSLDVNSDLQACILLLIDCYRCYIYIDAASPAIIGNRLDRMIKSLIVLNDQIDVCIKFKKPLEKRYIASALRSHTKLFNVSTMSLSSRECDSLWQMFVLSAIAVWNNN